MIAITAPFWCHLPKSAYGRECEFDQLPVSCRNAKVSTIHDFRECRQYGSVANSHSRPGADLRRDWLFDTVMTCFILICVKNSQFDLQIDNF